MSDEFFRALPDDVTPEMLTKSLGQLHEVCEVDPATIINDMALAFALRGVTRAVTNFILSKGAVEVIDLRTSLDQPLVMPFFTSANVLRRYENPNTKDGRSFRALPDRGRGVSMEVLADSEHVSHEIVIPNDHEVAQVLAGELDHWKKMEYYSRDFRSEPGHVDYPFDEEECLNGPSGASGRYFSVLQALISEDLLPGN